MICIIYLNITSYLKNNLKSVLYLQCVILIFVFIYLYLEGSFFMIINPEIIPSGNLSEMFEST